MPSRSSLRTERMQHWNIRVMGKVQGVNYRQSTLKVARELGLSGYTMNEPDGSVMIEAEGAEEALDALATWCRTGPPAGRVDKLICNAGPIVGYTQFEIRR
jgi:acylphosphatase